jgi:parallel beta-helix repeat protein
MCRGTVLTPASNVQAAINHAPPGTTFCFSRGSYRVSSLIPKSGDVLDGGDRAAILVGGKSARYAIYGDSTSHGPSDVTVRGFVIRDFNTPLQAGAIQDYNGPGWIIQDNHITKNAAAGVATGDNVRVLGNLIDHNRQEGFSAHGNDGLYQDNEIAYNNFNLAVNAGWEAGGGKAHGTTNLTFKSDYVYDNGGPGLWADSNNINTTFDDNMVSNNWGPGIYVEMSVNAAIINNTVTDNGMPSSPGGGNRLGWAWDAGIQLRRSGGLSASTPLIISGNTVVDNYNAISLIESPRSDCTKQNVAWRDSCEVQNVLVENNRIAMTEGATGAYQDGAGNGIFTNQNNIFRNNNYCVTSVIHPNDGHTFGWFAWMNGWLDFAVWQTFWLENDGTFTIGTCRLLLGDAGGIEPQELAWRASWRSGSASGRASGLARGGAGGRCGGGRCLLAEPPSEAGHCHSDPERRPHQRGYLRSLQLGIEERGHQDRRDHHQAERSYLSASVHPTPRQAPAARDHTPVPAQPERDPQGNTYHSHARKDVVVRVVRTAQWVGPVGHLGVVHEIGKVHTESQPVDEPALGHLFVVDERP